MDNQQLLAELLDLAERLGIEVRHIRMNGEGGGLCRLRGQAVLFIDTAASVVDQIASAGTALADHPDLENEYILPQVREVIEQFRHPME